MKKFVVTALALATASAQAYTVFDSQDTGTKFETLGSLRLVWQSTSNKETDNGTTSKEHINHAVANNGSRFGFRITQQLGAGFYGLGRVEWRFRGTSKSQHDFDDIYTRQLYAGFGHKDYGEIRYGNMTVITDDVKQTDLGNTLSLSDGLLIGSARRALQYTYNGIDGLTLGGFYGGSSPRGMNGLDLANKRKDAFGLAAIYKHKIDENQSVKVGTGVSRERAYNADHSTFARTAYSLGTAYTFDQTTIGVDLERAVTDDKGAIGNKRTQKEVRTVLEQKLSNDWRAYAMYAYKTDRNAMASSDSKTTRHQYMIGTEYYIVPKYVKTFVEGATLRAKNGQSKSRDNVVAIGLRAYW